MVAFIANQRNPFVEKLEALFNKETDTMAKWMKTKVIQQCLFRAPNELYQGLLEDSGEESIAAAFRLMASLYAYVQRIAYAEMVIPTVGAELKSSDAIPMPSSARKFKVKSIVSPGIRVKEEVRGGNEYILFVLPTVWTENVDPAVMEREERKLREKGLGTQP